MLKKVKNATHHGLLLTMRILYLDDRSSKWLGNISGHPTTTWCHIPQGSFFQ
jgi:hypothetical protein